MKRSIAEMKIDSVKSATIPNFQLPTPKELSSKRLALGVGSWELGVDAT
jgi:hypothetical protein